MLCHGSWRPPDESGKASPFYVNRETDPHDQKVPMLGPEDFRSIMQAVEKLALTIQKHTMGERGLFPTLVGHPPTNYHHT